MTSHWIRRGEVIRVTGLTRYQVDCAVDVGKIKTLLLPGMKQRMYSSGDAARLKEVKAAK